MCDPHVKTLVYELRHSEDLDYEKAVPLHHDIGVCVLHLEAGRLKCEMNEHYADEAAARGAVAPFLKACKMSAALELGPDARDFRYVDMENVDRNPGPGPAVVHTRSRSNLLLGSKANVHQSRTHYPAPPSRFVVDQSVSDMCHFFRG